MGANIGTSVTGMLVSSAQSGDREQFRRAVSGATCNDMFNWLSVCILLPLEVGTHYLFWLTTAIVDSLHLGEGEGGNSPAFLKAITTPFTNLIVQV